MTKARRGLTSHVLVGGVVVLSTAMLALACSGGTSIPDSCTVKGSGLGGALKCMTNNECGAGARCDLASSPGTCVLVNCLPEMAPCSEPEQCLSKLCTMNKCGAGGDGGKEGGGANPCANKPNYVFPDDPGTYPNGFSLEACAAYIAAEKDIETNSMSAAQFVSPLAGAKLPPSPPYKFSWSQAMLPMPMDVDAGAMGQVTHGNGYVIYFIDAATSKELLRVHTSQNTYTPDDTAWGKIVAAMGPMPSLQLKLVAASFTQNKITDGSKPVTHPQSRLVQITGM